MFFELIHYPIYQGKHADLARFMEEKIIPFQTQQGMSILGGALDAEGDENTYIWIRRFDSDAERDRLYNAVYMSDHWQNEIAPQLSTMMDREAIRITRLEAV